MAKELDISPLAYQVSPFMVDGKPRFIVQRRGTLEPSKSLSVYEQYLTHKTDSHNSVKSTLRQVMYLFTWAISAGIGIEELVLKGEFLTAVQIRQFAYWLKSRGTVKKDGIIPFSISGHNSVLMHSAKMICWFADHYGIGVSQLHSEIDRKIISHAQKKLFSNVKTKDRKVKCAPDLTEEEIFAIDQYLRPENRKDVSPEVAARDYLFWRLTIEFGLREGEIRALRLCDCPHKGQDYIKIVRIEERGHKYRDPRGANAPRPKTLSRDLGFLFKSQIPNLISDYTSKHRFKLVERAGKKHKQFLPGHDFLIVNHHRSPGAPLSRSGIQTMADQISENTGIPFHWHLSRHAFFNRTYEAVVALQDKEDRKVKLMDLVYWGGWSNPESLQLYINRARQTRGQKALMIWQKGENKWAALGL